MKMNTTMRINSYSLFCHSDKASIVRCWTWSIFTWIDIGLV